MKDDGGPAYPYPSTEIYETGMSLRDLFAGMAMQSLAGRIHASAAQAESSPAEAFEGVAELSYLQADAMLKERSK